MHKILSTSLLLALSGLSLNAVSAQSKEVMCHKDKNLYIASPAVQGHLNHGDSMGTCEESGPDDMDGKTAVLMMRCAADEVVSISASFEYATTPQVTTCTEELSKALTADFKLRSITSGSAEDDGSLKLYTDYLLLGDESGESEDD